MLFLPLIQKVLLYTSSKFPVSRASLEGHSSPIAHLSIAEPPQPAQLTSLLPHTSHPASTSVQGLLPAPDQVPPCQASSPEEQQ